MRDGTQRSAAEWMRVYFRHARTLNRQLLRYLDRKWRSMSFKERFFSAARSVTKTEPLVARRFCRSRGQIECSISKRSRPGRPLFLFVEARARERPLRRSGTSISYIMTHPSFPF